MKLNAQQLEKIYNEICKIYGPHNYGDCNQINSTVAVVFEKLGFKPFLYSGYVETVLPVIEDDGREEFTVNHVFIIQNGIIYDFAASQMQELLDINLNDSYFIGENEAYRRVSEHNLDTWANHDLVESILRQLKNT